MTPFKTTSLLSTVIFFFGIFTGLSQENFKIDHQPYIQALTDSSATIVWTTNKEAISWVELAPTDSTHFYHEDRPKYFATKDGFKTEDSVHRVHLKNLKSNTTYRYRVYSTEVLNHEWVNVDYGRTVATDVYGRNPLEFKTWGPSTNTKFSVINDIHGRNEVLNTLLDRGGLDELDFVVFNGDMSNNLMSEEQLFDDFLDTIIERMEGEKPFYYARGNHETRGPFAANIYDYFPSVSGKLYYLFKHGETAFIVLDTGEDKPDNDIEYGGIVNMDFYRSEQAEWLKEAVDNPVFKDAKYKIVIGHIPPLGRWHGEQELLEKFVPILNAAKIDIWLAAHYHRHLVKEADNKIHFPVIVNSNNNVLRADIDEDSGVFKVIDQNGKVIEEIEINSK